MRRRIARPPKAIANKPKVAGVGTTFLTWAGYSALTPAAPSAPFTAAGSGVIIGVGGVITGAGEVVKWLTDGSKDSWTEKYEESGKKSFTHATYTQIDCDPNQDYPTVEIPNPKPTLELTKSECVSDIGNDIASSGNLHPPSGN